MNKKIEKGLMEKKMIMNLPVGMEKSKRVW